MWRSCEKVNKKLKKLKMTPSKPNILVTGTPGAGKTHFCKAIAEKFDMKFLEISRIVEENQFTDGFDEVVLKSEI